MDSQVKAACLTIVIPALNEEDAIGSTIERCLAAIERIRVEGGVEDVELIVVSDGSTDRTAEIAQGYDGVRVIVFEQNRGYGAAIQEGWRQGRGDLLGFLDADGTCDPNYFAAMCRAIQQDSADVALGSRLGPDSQMPFLRRLGNRIFALLLGFLCGRSVTDTASGMRVVPRRALKDLYPLPDGLHFTPAMSARALLNDLRVVEIPMAYAERIGESKLSVVRDGVRFLRSILTGVLCYRPEKPFMLAFIACLLMLVGLGAAPTELYWEQRRLEEWMIYRFVACYLLGSVCLLLLLATAIAHQMVALRRRRTAGFWSSCIHSLLSQPLPLSLLLAGLTGSGLFFLWPGIVEFLSTGHVTLHWSRLLAGAFSLFSVVEVAVFSILMKVIAIWIANDGQTV